MYMSSICSIVNITLTASVNSYNPSVLNHDTMLHYGPGSLQ